MGCLDGKQEGRRKACPGNFQCKRCGAVSDKKKRICKPKKVKNVQSTRGKE